MLKIVFLIGILLSCKQINSLVPRNPVVGEWTLEAWQAYHLPAWFAAKTNDVPLIVGPDTIYGGPPPQLFDVRSLTLSVNGDCSESYVRNPGFPEKMYPQVDKGRWSLADSVVSLSVTNDFSHQLTYRASTDQLITDLHTKTATVRLSDDSVYTVKYSLRIYYRRSP